jgi:hypothetical protein
MLLSPLLFMVRQWVGSLTSGPSASRGRGGNLESENEPVTENGRRPARLDLLPRLRPRTILPGHVRGSLRRRSGGRFLHRQHGVTVSRRVVTIIPILRPC